MALNHTEREEEIGIRLTTSDHQFFLDTQKEALRLSKQYGFGVSFQFYAADSQIADQLFTFTFNIGLNIALSLFSAWLYDKLKDRKDSTLAIDGTKISVDRKVIERAIQIELRKRKSRKR